MHRRGSELALASEFPRRQHRSWDRRLCAETSAPTRQKEERRAQAGPAGDLNME